MSDIQTIDYSNNAHLFLKVEDDMVKIYLDDINYIEESENYIKVATKSNPDFIKSHISIKDIEEKLPHGAFIRIHQGFVLSVGNIESITKNTITVGKTVIPITAQYKEAFKTFKIA